MSSGLAQRASELTLSLERTRPERAPVFPVLLAFASGIATDAWIGLDRGIALPGAGGLLLAALAARRLEIRVPCLLAALFCLGTAAHHRVANDRSPDGIVRYVASEPALVRLRGRIISPPVIQQVEATGWSRDQLPQEQTRCLLACYGLQTESGAWLTVAGRVQFTLSGALRGARRGDDIETLGWLRQAGSPRNPGSFDLRARDRNQGIDARLFTEYAETVRVEPRYEVSIVTLAADARRGIGARFDQLLSPESAAVARAMLLDDRAALESEQSDKLQDAYRVTGAMHVLAISGMHIVILAGFLMILARLVVVSPLLRSLGIVALIWVYAGLTGFGPPVTRAAIFLTLWAVGICGGRGTTVLNTVALAGLALIAWDPLLLFDLGAQLSFLAVLGMSWSGRLVPDLARWRNAEEEPVAHPMVSRWFWWMMRSVLVLELAGIGIWLFTGPLIASEFGIVAPIGLPLNLILVPLSTLTLAFGYIVLAICPLSMTMAVPFALAFDASLWLMNRIVEWASIAPGGHDIATAPPFWWLAMWYPLLLASLLWLRRTPRRLRPVIPLLLWGIVAMGGAVPHTTGGLRLTMLDVGHGGAILIETPEGQTLLYDCGSMHDDRRAAEAVWDCLRHRGHRELDGLIVSHADLDHGNNIPALLRMGRVRAVFVNRTFLNFSQPMVAEACEAAGSRDIPIWLIASEDTLRLDGEFRTRVLHPPDRRPGEDDNANSLVLQINYAGRRILLTGDLEGSGQYELFGRHPAEQYDVFVAPHHGGALANTSEFARWARPKAVLVSCSDRVNIKRVQETYPNARQTYFTSRDGAITLTIAPSGTMAFETEVGK